MNHSAGIVNTARLLRSALVVAAVLLASIQPSAAQGPSAPPVAEMKKLELLAGEWKGEGWALSRTGRSEFVSLEKVEQHLDGLLLSIEGLHHEKLQAGAKGRVVHHAFAVVSFDPDSNSYLFDAYQMEGRHVNAKGKLVEPGTFQWGFTTPQGSVRFTIKFDASKWSEIGEFSRDGVAWQKNFEMNLQRVK